MFQDDAPGRGEARLDAGRLAGDPWQSGGSGGAGADDDYNLESFVAAEISLADHLAEQLALAIADPTRRLIGQYLIDAVDEAGYLRVELDAVADKLGCPVALVEEVLAVLQRFDPSGVCARDLKECLALQLRERDRCDPAMGALLDHL
ncbi:hypothetical protein J8J40_22165, partial [Mycobacterium tuberculosis]|nr:hypothetical protein [Mycobacterium tuberculosis]